MRASLLLAALAVGPLACGDSRPGPRSSAPSAPALTIPDRETTTVYSYLECIECVDGELAAVGALRDSAVAILGQALIAGPPPERVEHLRRHLDSMYALVRDDIAQSGETEALPGRSAYVGVALGNYEATYRSRAALALGRIRTPDARRLLDSAVRLDSAGAWPKRPEVTTQIRAALHGF